MLIHGGSALRRFGDQQCSCTDTIRVFSPILGKAGIGWTTSHHRPDRAPTGTPDRDQRTAPVPMRPKMGVSVDFCRE